MENDGKEIVIVTKKYINMDIDTVELKYEKFIKLFHKEMYKKFNEFCDKYRLSRNDDVYTMHFNRDVEYMPFIKQMANLCYGNFHSETSPKEIMKEWEEIRDNITDKYYLYFLKTYHKEVYRRMRRDNLLIFSKLDLHQINKYVPDGFCEIINLVEFVYLRHFITE